MINNNMVRVNAEMDELEIIWGNKLISRNQLKAYVNKIDASWKSTISTYRRSVNSRPTFPIGMEYSHNMAKKKINQSPLDPDCPYPSFFSDGLTRSTKTHTEYW